MELEYSMNKNQLLTLLFSVLFFSCGRDDATKNIEFNGFKDINSIYKFNIVVIEGKGSKFITSDKITSEFEIDLSIRLFDSTKCESTISKIKYEQVTNPFFKYVFDTDLDTVTIVSDYMKLRFNNNEKKKANSALTTLKNIRGKSILTTLNNQGVLKLIKNEISSKDYFLNSRYNPEKQINQIFKPSDLLTLFDFVFYLELGSYTKGKQYKFKKENDSLTFVFNNDKTIKDIFYSEQRFNAYEYRSVESRIDIKTGNLLESKFIERIKKEREFPGIYKIIEKKATVKKIN